MEAWKLLAGAAVFLVIWAGLVTLLGHEIGPIEVVLGMVFAMIGIYLGDRLSKRLVGDEE